MSLVAFSARNHPQQVGSRGRRDFVDDRGTPASVFDPLHEHHRFTIDVAAAAHNAKLSRFYSIEDDGLLQPWTGERVWCNPPYSDIRPWIEKAWAEIRSGCDLVVMLLPANRTEQGWWQDLVEPFRDREAGILRTQFLRGRTRFHAGGDREIGPNERPPFGCVLLTFAPTPPAPEGGR